MKRTPLRAVPSSEPACYPYENPKPCGCPGHIHTLAVEQLRVRRQSDGSVVKTILNVGDYETRRTGP